MHPIFPHDCDLCKYIGTETLISGEKDVPGDWYICPKTEFSSGSVIFRFGELGDYWSLDVKVMKSLPPAEAGSIRLRAMQIFNMYGE